MLFFIFEDLDYTRNLEERPNLNNRIPQHNNNLNNRIPQRGNNEHIPPSLNNNERIREYQQKYNRSSEQEKDNFIEKAKNETDRLRTREEKIANIIIISAITGLSIYGLAALFGFVGENKVTPIEVAADQQTIESTPFSWFAIW